VVIEIADTGMGMEPEVMSRAFEPFYTTKGPGEGTGLGLSAVKGTVDSHGGTIEVDSTPGAGTTFRIRLPVLTASEQPVEDAAMQLPRGSGDVLIVDDEARVRHAASALLSSLGYRITLAEDGDHALQILQDSRAGFGLVLLDSRMPGRSSAETFKQLRERLPDLPVLFWSGRAQDAAIEDLLQAAGTDFIQKPYRALDLADRVRRLTRGSPAQGDAGTGT
jgi:CheY-like chemotaxis protein